MIEIKQAHRFLLVSFKQRKAGSMEKNGETISWDAGYKLTVIPFLDDYGTPVKLSVAEEDAANIESKLSKVHWGAVVDVYLRGSKFATDVDVVLAFVGDLPIDGD